MNKSELTIVSIIVVISVMVLMPFLTGCTELPSDATLKEKAKVLAIEDRILEGEMIGALLSSPSGKFGKVNKVGVEFTIGGMKFLKDLEVNFATLAHFKDSDVLPLKIVLHRTSNYDRFDYVEIFLKNNKVQGFSLSDSQGNEIGDWYLNNRMNYYE